MNRTRIIFSSGAVLAVALLAAAGGRAVSDGGRIRTPEGYLQFEDGSDGGNSAGGSFSVTPAPAGGRSRSGSGQVRNPDGTLEFEDGHTEWFTTPQAKPDGADESGPLEPPPDGPVEPVPPKRKTAAQLCQPLLDRFLVRLAELRGDPVISDGGSAALSPAIQRAMFGRVALRQGQDPTDQVIPELTWDDALKEANRAFHKCLKAERRR